MTALLGVWLKLRRVDLHFWCAASRLSICAGSLVSVSQLPACTCLLKSTSKHVTVFGATVNDVPLSTLCSSCTLLVHRLRLVGCVCWAGWICWVSLFLEPLGLSADNHAVCKCSFIFSSNLNGFYPLFLPYCITYLGSIVVFVLSKELVHLIC